MCFSERYNPFYSDFMHTVGDRAVLKEETWGFSFSLNSIGQF